MKIFMRYKMLLLLGIIIAFTACLICVIFIANDHEKAFVKKLEMEIENKYNVKGELKIIKYHGSLYVGYTFENVNDSNRYSEAKDILKAEILADEGKKLYFDDEDIKYSQLAIFIKFDINKDGKYETIVRNFDWNIAETSYEKWYEKFGCSEELVE